MLMGDRHVAFAADENFAMPLLTAVYTYCLHNYDTNVHIVYSDLTDTTLNDLGRICQINNHTLRCHKVSRELVDTKNGCTVSSVATCYRYLLPSLLGDVDRVVYIDSDTMIVRDLWKFLDGCNYDLKDICAGAVRDLPMQQSSGDYLSSIALEQKIPPNDFSNNYFNAGVLYLNLSLIRSMGLEEVFFELDKNDYRCRDQDVLNLSLFGKVVFLMNV